MMTDPNKICLIGTIREAERHRALVVFEGYAKYLATVYGDKVTTLSTENSVDSAYNRPCAVVESKGYQLRFDTYLTTINSMLSFGGYRIGYMAVRSSTNNQWNCVGLQLMYTELKVFPDTEQIQKNPDLVKIVKTIYFAEYLKDGATLLNFDSPNMQ